MPVIGAALHQVTYQGLHQITLGGVMRSRPVIRTASSAISVTLALIVIPILLFPTVSKRQDHHGMTHQLQTDASLVCKLIVMVLCIIVYELKKLTHLFMT